MQRLRFSSRSLFGIISAACSGRRATCRGIKCKRLRRDSREGLDHVGSGGRDSTGQNLGSQSPQERVKSILPMYDDDGLLPRRYRMRTKENGGGCA